MGERWRFNRFRFRMVVLLVMCLLNNMWRLGLSLNAEGLALLRFREGVMTDPFGALLNWNDDDGLNDPCSWFGVECSDGKVVILNLKDLCLEGTLAPELGNLIHIKSIILRNNSFYGVIPKEIEELKELEELDLGFNNFSGPLPFDIGDSLSLTILLLDNNDFLEDISPEIHELNMLSELQVDETQLIDAVHGTSCQRRVLARNIAKSGNVVKRRLLHEDSSSISNVHKNENKRRSLSSPKSPSRAPSHSPSLPKSPSRAPSHSSSSPKVHSRAPSHFQSHSRSNSSKASSPNASPTPSTSLAPAPDLSSPTPGDPHTPSISTPAPSPSASPSQYPKASIAHPPTTSVQGHAHHTSGILAASIGAPIFILIVAVGVLLCRNTKVVSVKPWATGLSGQLQKAFVTGVPSLRRSELETACEDFSNIIDSSSNGTIYKGTLSSGVEIAVVSTVVTYTKDWSKNFEAQFRKKIDTLSKVNHKNFVNLLGYCEEEEPFTRMMVFEYAPNGTLFEHLHIKEAEHLDWGARLRIGMGMAYCLDYMHHLNPPVAHKDLNSSVIYLTEDYAAQISDFEFWHEVGVSKESDATEFQDMPSPDVESNVYSFGVILLEMITGRLPYSVENGTLVGWASIYLRGEQPCTDMVDPMLKSFQEDELEKLCAVIASCIHPDPKQRPTMREVATQLRAITALGPDGAIPKLTPLWWAELEILSTEAC